MTIQTRYSLYVLGAALLTAVALVLAEIAIQFYRVPTIPIIVLGNIVGGVLLLTGALREETRFWQQWQGSDWLRIFIATLLLFCLGIFFGLSAINQIGAGKSALMGQLESPFVVLLAILFLGEQLSLRRWIAGGLAVCGSILINFDPTALTLQLGWGELLAFLAPLSFAIGITLLKPLLDRVDAKGVTGFGLILGTVFFLPFVFTDLSAWQWGGLAFLATALVGVTRGLAWLAYNMSLRHIGPARCAIIFISFAFFTVLLQLGVATTMPRLGLQIPTNLLVALSGGALVTAGIVILQTDPEAKSG